MGKTDYVPVECVNVPKLLFQDRRYSGLSADAKLLYSLLLDRKNVARLNEWIDPMGTPYVIYPKSEMKKHLNASRYRVDAALDELAACEQMVLVTQPNPGRPCQIYVKDIANKYYEEVEEKPMCMMRNDENKEKKMMMPCMGIPGMHGVAILMDPEEMMGMLDALEEVIGTVEKVLADKEAEQVDDKTDAQEAESEQDPCADCDGCNDFYNYQDENYWSLPKKQRKKIDMIARGYIDEDGEPDEDVIEADACDLGESLGLILGTVEEDDPEAALELQEAMGELWKANKNKQLKTIVKTISILYGSNSDYIANMDCCTGEVMDIFLTEMLNVMSDTMASMRRGRAKKNDKE